MCPAVVFIVRDLANVPACAHTAAADHVCNSAGVICKLRTGSCRQLPLCTRTTSSWRWPLTGLVVPQGSRPKPLTVMLWCSHVAARISLKVAENATHPALQWVNRALLQKNPVGFGEPPRHDGSKAEIDAVLWSPVLVSLCRNSNLPLFAV